MVRRRCILPLLCPCCSRRQFVTFAIRSKLFFLLKKQLMGFEESVDAQHAQISRPTRPRISAQLETVSTGAEIETLRELIAQNMGAA